MLDYFLNTAVILLPTILSLVGVLVSIKAPHSKHHTWMRLSLIALGIVVSGVTFWQQSRSQKAHAAEVAGLNGTLSSVRGELKDVQSQTTDLQLQVKTLTGDQQTEVARRQQAEKDLMLALQSTSRATRQGVAEDIRKTPLKVSVSGGAGHSDEEKQKRKEVRTKLSLMMGGGRGLMSFCVNPPQPAPGNQPFSCEDQARAWEINCAKYIADNMDASYLQRFESATGLSMSWAGVDTKTNNILQRLHNQTDMIEQFIKELLD